MFECVKMSDGRKRLSGHQFQKQAKDKEAKLQNLLSKTKKLDSFFKVSEKSSNDTSSNTQNSSSPSSNVTGAASNNSIIVSSSSSPSNSSNAGFINCSNSNTDTYVNSAEIDENNRFCFQSDPAKWTINDETRDYIAKHGVQQNLEGDLSGSKRAYDDYVRQVSKKMFERQHLNGEKVLRSWLVYSQSTGRVFCGPCRAFDDRSSHFGSNEGFNDWKNATSRLASHENSAAHKLHVLNLKQRGQHLGRIDQALTIQVDEEITYWRNVLKRVVATVKALASRGLAFRGQDEIFGSSQNGNLISYYLISIVFSSIHK